MKKYLLFLLAFLPMVVFTACSSSDDEETNGVSLDGTIWINNDEASEITLQFKKTTCIYYSPADKYNPEFRQEGTYKYNPPKIEITYIDNETNKKETVVGRIENDKLYLGEWIYTKRK